MGRNMTPTAIQDAKGYFQRHPERKRAAATEDGKPLGSPPKHLSEMEAELWKEMKKDLLPGVAKKSDRHAFETMVVLKLRERSGLILAADRGQLITLYSHFGLTPASRCKIAVPAAPKSSLADFLKKSKPAPEQSEPQAPADLSRLN
jgi:phage terminase small subunit